MKKFYVLAFTFAAMTLPAFAQEKAAPAAKVVPEAKTTTTVVEGAAAAAPRSAVPCRSP